LLTPDETFVALDTGLLPNKNDSEANQEEYVKQREKEMYFPLVGGSQQNDDDGSGGASSPSTGRPKGTTGPKSVKTPSTPKGKSKAFDINKLREVVLLANDATNELTKSYLKINKKKNLTDSDKKKIEVTATTLITNESPKVWVEKVKEYIKELPVPNDENYKKLEQIKKDYPDLNNFSSALLLHCEAPQE
jgi:hypothetical protein